MNEISKIWTTAIGEGIVKQKPRYLYAIDESGEEYYVAKDDSTILYLVKMTRTKTSTFVIPKKTCVIVDSEYYQINSNKLQVISCTNSYMDTYATFVVDKIINK